MPTCSSSVVWRLFVPVIAAGAGVLFAVASHTAGGTDLRSGETDLAGVVAAADHRVKVKQQEVASGRDELEKLGTPSGAKGGALADLRSRASAIAPQTGLAPLTGRSVTVTLDDSKQSVDSLPEGGSPDWLVVHQQDVQSVVNALWRGGAKGMILMDQRVVSTSAVRCVGNTLILQGRVYSPPFTITAVGDPDALKTALAQDKAVQIYRQYVDAVGLGYDVKASDRTTLPAFNGPLELVHARVDD